jgi:hypothetical protein
MENAYSMYRQKQIRINVSLGNHKGKDYLVQINADGKMILKKDLLNSGRV